MVANIFRFLIIFCVTQVVTEAPATYQIEENHNITLQWTFTPYAYSYSTNLYIDCHRSTDHRVLLYYNVQEGVQESEYQDEQFAGRVQLDKEVLRKGQIRVHVFRSRIEDSGLYNCIVKTKNEISSSSHRVEIILPIEVNVTQMSYQAEENDNITLEWTFTTKTECSQSTLSIYCDRMRDGRVLYQYFVHEGAEVSESQDEQFSGRVQSDKEVLREGQIRLHVSRLRTEDSGHYVCKVRAGDCLGSDRFTLNVNAEPCSTVPHPVTTRPPPETRERTGLYFVLTFLIFAFLCCCVMKRKGNRHSAEKKPLRTSWS